MDLARRGDTRKEAEEMMPVEMFRYPPKCSKCNSNMGWMGYISVCTALWKCNKCGYFEYIKSHSPPQKSGAPDDSGDEDMKSRTFHKRFIKTLMIGHLRLRVRLTLDKNKLKRRDEDGK